MGTSPWLHRFATLLAAATFLLIFAGGLVTSTGSGLAVPDWPLSFGQLFPRMEGGVLFEHGHRLIATAVGLLTVVMSVWVVRADARPWVRRLALSALAAVILQGVLGGVTVLLRLPDATSIAHAGLAQLFFCMTVTLAVVTAPGWFGEWPRIPDADHPSARALTLATALAVYGQILIGALVRHTGSGLVIPDFPLAYGRLWPPITSSFVGYQMAHRVGAVLVSVLAIWTALAVLRRYHGEPRLWRPALALIAVLVWQVFLGALTIWTRKSVIPTTAHVASGALLLATALLLAIRARRLLARPERAVASAAP